MDEHTADAAGDAAPGGPREPLGTLGEEAVKLLTAASAWAREQRLGDEPDGSDPDGSAPDDGAAEEPCPSCRSNQEVACTWCPVCQAASFARSASPELRAAVRGSVVSLTELARTVLDSLAEHQRPGEQRAGEQRPGEKRGGDRPGAAAGPAGGDVQHIDLADDEGDDPWD